MLRRGVETLTSIPIPPSKRNGSKREDRIPLLNATRKVWRDMMGGDEYRNGGRQKGSPGKRDLKREAILAYALAHTGVSESEIAGALGVSRPTAIK